MVVWFEHGSSGQASICRAFNASDRCKALSTSNWETTKAGPNASFKQVEKCGNLVEKMKFIKLQQNLIFFWTKLLPMVWFCRKKTELGKKTHLFWVTLFRQDLPQLWFKKKHHLFGPKKNSRPQKNNGVSPVRFNMSPGNRQRTGWTFRWSQKFLTWKPPSGFLSLNSPRCFFKQK